MSIDLGLWKREADQNIEEAIEFVDTKEALALGKASE